MFIKNNGDFLFSFFFCKKVKNRVEKAAGLWYNGNRKSKGEKIMNTGEKVDRLIEILLPLVENARDSADDTFSAEKMDKVYNELLKLKEGEKTEENFTGRKGNWAKYRKTEEAAEYVIYQFRIRKKELTNRKLQMILNKVKEKNEKTVPDEIKEGKLFPMVEGVYMKYCVWGGNNLVSYAKDLEISGELSLSEKKQIEEVCERYQDTSFFDMLKEIRAEKGKEEAER